MSNPIPVAIAPEHAALYLANRKSTGVAYLLWFFLGMFGAHRFYAGRIASAVVLLLLTLVSLLLSFLVIGLFLLVIPAVWWLIDALLIPGMISGYNGRLAMGIPR